MANPVQKTSHEGILPYAAAANAQNMIAAPVLFPWLYKQGHLSTRVVGEMSDESIKKFLHFPHPYSAFASLSYDTNNAVECARAGLRIDGTFLAAAIGITGILSGITVYENNQLSAPLPEDVMTNLKEKATQYCSGQAVSKATTEISEILNSQAARMQNSGLNVAFTKPASEITHAIQECVPVRLASLKSGENFPSDFFAGASGLLAVCGAYVALKMVFEVHRDIKNLKQRKLEADVLNGDLALVRAEDQKRRTVPDSPAAGLVAPDAPAQRGLKVYC